MEDGTTLFYLVLVITVSFLPVFTLEEQYTVDFEAANHFVSTYPHSRFVRLLVVQKPGMASRLTLINRSLTEQTPAGSSEVILPDDDALVETLAKRFDLHFAAGTRFAYQER